MKKNKQISWSSLLEWDDDTLHELRCIGYAYLKQGKYETAKIFFEGLLALGSTEVYDKQTLGAIHLQKGNGKKALEYLEEALEIDPSHEATCLNHLKALFMCGQNARGIALSKQLTKTAHASVANQASALLMAYS